MPTDQQTFAIVGAGLAGAKAAETLREEGFDGRLVLLGAEPERPYERPPLSKEYLRGEAEREAAYVHEAGFYAEHEIELRVGESVVGLDAGRQRARAEERRAARLRPAAADHRRRAAPAEHPRRRARRRPLPADARRQRRAARPPGRRRPGWSSSAPAGSAPRSPPPPASAGVEVTVIAPHAVPFERVLGPEVGAIYRDIHLDHGVEMLLGAGRRRRSRATAEWSGSARRTAERSTATPSSSASAPRRGAVLAAAAGLAVDNGVLVDGRLETSVPGIFAAGDVANHLHPALGRLRVEHWDNALHQGPAAARGMLGSDEPYARTPVLLLRPVRRRDGVLGPRGGLGSRRLPRRPRDARVHRLLARRTVACWPG